MKWRWRIRTEDWRDVSPIINDPTWEIEGVVTTTKSPGVINMESGIEIPYLREQTINVWLLRKK